MVRATDNVEDIVRKIKDLFYTSKKSFYDIFKEAKTGKGIEVQGLIKLV